MYPYHNKIKQRIRAGELIGYEYVDDYNGQGERLLLHFRTAPFIRPVRPERYAEYVDVLVEWRKRKEKSNEQIDP